MTKYAVIGMGEIRVARRQRADPMLRAVVNDDDDVAIGIVSDARMKSRGNGDADENRDECGGHEPARCAGEAFDHSVRRTG